MRFLKLLLLLPLVLGLGFTTTAQAQTTGSCSRALGEQFLDINNVRARILNTGGLFYRGEPHVYEIPKGSGSNAIFASGIWLAGEVDGQLRAAATRYGEWEFWAGPLDDVGNPPQDCAVYDRVYKVNKTDVEEYDATGATTPDLRDWPTGLGAPTLAPPDNGIDDDQDGEIDEGNEQIVFDITVPLAQRVDRKVDLAGGERPAILGDQTIWWVMNDRGNIHESTEAPPIGVEVHGTAFAFNTAGDIGNTTFYKFNIFYKGNVPLENAYLGIFSDPDLGDFADDYVGSDTLLGLGYVYNSDNEDTGGEGYGSPPPAAGYDFFQGPVVPGVETDTAYVSGRPVPGSKNLQMTSFVYYNNGGGINEDPQTGADYYNYMRGRWKDGRRITFGGDGFTGSITDDPVNFMYPGDPETLEGWSEFNPDPIGGTLPPNETGDRRFVMSTGPFVINPGDQQEIVFGVVFGQGIDNRNSVTVLKQADALAQAAFDVNFELPAPPAAPAVTVTELDGQVVLEWSNSTRSNNYLESYVEEDPFAPEDNPNYEFEGYKVYQFADLADQTGSVIATYDVVNGVTRVIDGAPGEPTSVVARGSDTGVQTFHVINNLTNYTTHYFGVQAYAFNEPSFPKIYASPITRVEAVPSINESVIGENTRTAAQAFAESDFVAEKVGIGDGSVTADIANPGSVLDAQYQVRFYDLEDGAGTTYDITRDGTTIFDGAATGEPAPQRANVVLLDGLVFSVEGPEPDFTDFAIITNANGPVPEDENFAAANFQGYPVDGNPTDAQQAGEGHWLIHTGGARSSYEEFISRTTRDGSRWDVIVPWDYEVRFTEEGGKCIIPDAFKAEGPTVLVDVPFELWRIGINTPDDPSDDIRMWCHILDEDENDLFNMQAVDSPVSSANNDPYTDWIYWVLPTDETPGDAGYLDTVADFEADITLEWTHNAGVRVMDRMVFANWNGADLDLPPDSIVFNQELPEVGSVFRIVTAKPNQPADTYTFSTEGFGIEEKSMDEQRADLDLINVVPNPYKGASSYERSSLVDQVRFTNMPDQATIRVFTLSGSLVTTIEKNSPERFISWNLTTSNNLPLASGMYLIHIDVPGVGSKVIKFGMIAQETILNVF